MCLSNEEMASIHALQDTLQETVDLARVLYDSVKPPVGNSNGAVESPEMRVALRPSQIPTFLAARVKA